MAVLDLFRLSGKTALVTGSSAGLGAAIAVALAEAGAVVICHGNTRPAEETCRKIEGLGRRGAAIKADLARPSGAQELFEKTRSGAPVQPGRLGHSVTSESPERFSIEPIGRTRMD